MPTSETSLISSQPGAAFTETLCMSCADDSCDFKPVVMGRRTVGPRDVLIDMKYCGVCHSDLHHAANHNKGLGATQYPCVPGHELAGICTEVGAEVTKVKVGDQVGVGCMVDACLECKECLAGEEQKCKNGMTGTYGGKDKHGHAGFGNASLPHPGVTIGGYTSKMVVDERFAVIIPQGYPLEAAGPVMCAGITMYDPLKANGAGPGKRVGIIGLGGLGQMGVKLAKAMGAEVTVISRGTSKRAYAMETCGADAFLNSKSADDMKEHAGTIDIILNTIPSYHNYTAYTPLLKKTTGSKQILLGLHKGIGAAMVADKVRGGKSRIGMSGIGGIRNTQEVMDLCAKNDIKPDIEVLPAEKLNHIFQMLDDGNATNLRYVIDIAGTLNEDTAARCTDPPPKLLVPTGTLSLPAVLKECCWLICCCKT